MPFKSRRLQICEKCCLPACSEACRASQTHSDDCASLSKLLIRRNIDVQKRFIELAPCLGVIRLIRLKKNRDHPVNRLISARDESFQLADWEEKIVETLTSSCQDGFCRPEVVEALGIFVTNGVKVRRSNLFAPCVALFPVFSMANHSCVCSAMYNAEFRPTNGSDKSSNVGQFFVDLRAQNNIRRGTQISIRYLDSLFTTPQRKKASKSKWNFVCQCPRCIDPSERGTLSSGVSCNKCSSGYLLPHFSSPEEVDCSWICNVCCTEIGDDIIKGEILNPLSESKLEITKSVADEDDDEDDGSDEDDDEDADEGDESEEEDDNDFSETMSGLGALERWLWTASQKLHPNHVWILELEFQLVVAYSRLIEDMSSQSTPTSGLKVRPILERIVQMAMHLLEVFAKLDPGSTRWRGMLMQKLVPPWMEISKQDHETGSISTDVFKQRVFFGMLTAQEAVQCLKVYRK